LKKKVKACIYEKRKTSQPTAQRMRTLLSPWDFKVTPGGKWGSKEKKRDEKPTGRNSVEVPDGELGSDQRGDLHCFRGVAARFAWGEMKNGIVE